MLILEQIIGWRENARRILVYLTDAGFHFAGDGKVSNITLYFACKVLNFPMEIIISTR